MSPTTNTEAKIAVRCENCKKILAFKLGSASGYLQLKCPACKAEVKVDLSLRRGRVFNRRNTFPITISFV